LAIFNEATLCEVIALPPAAVPGRSSAAAFFGCCLLLADGQPAVDEGGTSATFQQRFGLHNRPPVFLSMATIGFFFMAQFALFTYVRRQFSKG